MKTGNTGPCRRSLGRDFGASMEPGHEDREYHGCRIAADGEYWPQWSPVMKTGNTSRPRGVLWTITWPQWSPVMKTGNTRSGSGSLSRPRSLNGARS